MNQRYSKNPPPKFHVGDLVRLRRFADDTIYEIADDHGNIGRGGRRFYLLKTREKEFDTVACPEDWLEPVPGNEVDGKKAAPMPRT